MELKHIQIFNYKTRELKEKFYIDNLTTTSREFYQVLLRFNNLPRTVEYTRDKDKSIFKETYKRR